jgi:hypothetical protein
MAFRAMIFSFDTGNTGGAVGVVVGMGLGVNVSQGVTVLSGVGREEGIPTGMQPLNPITVKRRVIRSFFIDVNAAILNLYYLSTRKAFMQKSSGKLGDPLG